MPNVSALALRLLHVFAARRARVVVLAGALALLSPSLSGPLLLDDHVLALKARAETGVAGLHAEPLWLFRFTTGRPEDNRALMDGGVLLPWWSDPSHLNAFFRPLSSLTHVLDFALWPGSAALMHAHSLLWYALLLLLVFHVYSRLVPPDATTSAQGAAQAAAVAGFSFFLFAVDDAHGPTAAWIANRNALVAAALALPALSFHHRARSEGHTPSAWLGPLCFALGLCAGETALAIFGYLVAYAVCVERGEPGKRALALLPYVLLLAAHRVVYRVFGLGSFGSSAYHDPLTEPLGFAFALAYNLPALLSAQLGAPVADFAFWGEPALRMPLLLAAIATLGVLFWAARPLFAEDAHARFWGLGMLLAAIPVSASLPGERLLLCVGLGASQLVARLFALAARGDAAISGGSERGLRALAVLGLLLAHVVAAPLLMPVRAYAMNVVGDVARRLDTSLPQSAEIERQRVIVVNVPFDVAASYLQVMRASRGAPRPLGVHWLASASSALTVTRTAERTLRLTLAEGFLRQPEETHYRADASALGLGARVALGTFDARVVAVTEDGRPKTVDFTFVHRLDSTRYRFMCYRRGAFLPWRPPSMGTTMQFPAQEFFEVVGEEARR